ncbi:MAG: hypothetical protein ACWGMZ_10195, partial [Thermoguttaceae bacterium]
MLIPPHCKNAVLCPQFIFLYIGYGYTADFNRLLFFREFKHFSANVACNCPYNRHAGIYSYNHAAVRCPQFTGRFISRPSPCPYMTYIGK